MNRRSVEAGRGHITISYRNRLAQTAKGIQRDLSMMSRAMQNHGSIMAASGAAIAVPLAVSVKALASFDDKMRAVAAISGATDAQLQMLEKTAKELGRTTSFTAVEVADLMTVLSRAGFDPSQVNQMTEAVLSLARATGTDAEVAAGAMAKTIRQFSLEASDATRIADAFTSAANNSFNTVETLAESMGYAGKPAKDLGLSVEETLAILGTLGNFGIDASAAGTALRRIGLIAASENEKFQELFGFSTVDAEGNVRPLIDIMDDLSMSVSDMGTAEQATKMKDLFGLLGVTGASSIAGDVKGTRQLFEIIKQGGGIADKTAKKMDDGIGGSLRRASSAAEGLQLAIGGALEQSAKDGIEYITDGISALTAFVEENEELVVVLGTGAIALMGFGGAVIAVGTGVQVTSFAIGGLGVAIGALTSPIALSIAAAGGLGVVLATQTKIGGEAIDWLSDKFEPLVEDTKTAAAGIAAAFQAGDIKGAFEILVKYLKSLWQGFADGAAAGWAIAVNSILNAGSRLTEEMSSLLEGLIESMESMWEKYKGYYDTVNKGARDGLIFAGETVTGLFDDGSQYLGPDGKPLPYHRGSGRTVTIGEDNSSAFDSGVGKAIDDSIKDNLATAKEFAQLTREAANAEREKRTKELEDRIGKRDEERRKLRQELEDQAKAAINKRNKQEREKAEAEAEAARKQKKEQQEKELLNQFDKFLSGQIDRLFGRDKMVLANAGNDSLSATGIDPTSGEFAYANGPSTFSSYGAMLLGLGNNPQDQTAKNTAQIVKNTQGIFDQLRDREERVKGRSMAIDAGERAGLALANGFDFAKTMLADGAALASLTLPMNNEEDPNTEILEQIAENTSGQSIARAL